MFWNTVRDSKGSRPPRRPFTPSPCRKQTQIPPPTHTHRHARFQQGGFFVAFLLEKNDISAAQFSAEAADANGPGWPTRGTVGSDHQQIILPATTEGRIKGVFLTDTLFLRSKRTSRGWDSNRGKGGFTVRVCIFPRIETLRSTPQ